MLRLKNLAMVMAIKSITTIIMLITRNRENIVGVGTPKAGGSQVLAGYV